MQMRGVAVGIVGWALAATLPAAALTTALFEAPAKGADLVSIDRAEQVIQLVQGQRAVLWSSVEGTVGSLTVLGWPSQNGVHDLGGVLMIEQPADGTAGVIDLGEKPMSLRFEMGG